MLEYYLLVQDNFNLDNQTHPPVPSGQLRIAIISQEDLTSKVIDDLRTGEESGRQRQGEPGSHAQCRRNR